MRCLGINGFCEMFVARDRMELDLLPAFAEFLDIAFDFGGLHGVYCNWVCMVIVCFK